MTFGSFLKKVVFFIPLIGGWYASKNPSSRAAINLVNTIIQAQGVQGLTRAQVLEKLRNECTKRGFTPELADLTVTYARNYMDQLGVK